MGGGPLPTPEEMAGLPSDGGENYNRLIHATSPYLLQHAANPVDWYPWGEEALNRAKAEDKPIFLSVGYAACHWCHVMEHESFEDDEVAAALNRDFIPVKVDREERPDLDQVYMLVTQLLTGRGGWPNSVWLTPDGKPWFAGTYFPRNDRYGHPGFLSLLGKLAGVWRDRRSDVDEQARRLAQAVHEQASSDGGFASVWSPRERHRAIDRLIRALMDSFDAREGGFGGAPKFPPHASLLFLLGVLNQGAAQSVEVQAMLTKTLEAMALAGIHDHVGGGFHRYATDDHWLVPHFEKMLYDNALLARIYAEAFETTGDPLFADTTRHLCDWVLRDMTSRHGLFYSALDADSEGVEGKFYVWTHAEILSVLGDVDGQWFADTFRIKPQGNFHDEATGEATGTNIPHHRERLSAEDQLRAAALKKCLREHRDQRVWPLCDDKMLAGWNGLMISGLAVAGQALNEPDYLAAAKRAATSLLEHLSPEPGRLCRTWRQSRSDIPGFLEDYAAVALGFTDLAACGGGDEWRDHAVALMNTLDREFADGSGGYFNTSDRHETLMTRCRDPLDQAIPSGNGLAAMCCHRLAAVTGESKWTERGNRIIEAFAAWMQRIPTATATLHWAALAGPKEDTASEVPDDPSTVVLRRAPVTLRIHPAQIETSPGQTTTCRFSLVFDEGWYLQAKSDGNPEVALEMESVAGCTLSGVRFDEDAVTWLADVAVDFIAPRGETAWSFRFRYQACNERECTPPSEVKIELPVVVT